MHSEIRSASLEVMVWVYGFEGLWGFHREFCTGRGKFPVVIVPV
jgi:hypothetical protein